MSLGRAGSRISTAVANHPACKSHSGPGRGSKRFSMMTVKIFAQFARNERGNVLATFAIAVTVLLGAAGLGTEAASWYATKRDMQNAADLGAAGGALALKINYASASSATD